MEIITTSTDPIRLSFLIALLRDAGLDPVLLDQHIAAVEGNIGAFPRRLAVPRDQAGQARRVLREAQVS